MPTAKYEDVEIRAVPLPSSCLLSYSPTLTLVAAVGATRTRNHQTLPIAPGSKWQQTPELGKGPPPTGTVCLITAQTEGANSFTLDTTEAQLFHPFSSASGASSLESPEACLSWDQHVPACSVHAILLHPGPLSRAAFTADVSTVIPQHCQG